ncbi:MAG: glycogen debranching protein GlgX [Trueperaceae bacterium]|nr:glycogen debranching protein GlgX [Trueperaceae bacterium]
MWPGHPFPLGTTWDGRGVNVAIYSEYATRVEWLLFANAYDPAPVRSYDLPHRTGPVWHGYVPGVGPGLLYGLRVHGRWAPREGHRFNPAKVVLDPYARAIGRPLTWHPSLYGDRPRGSGEERDQQDSAPYAPLGVVIDDGFDWQGVRAPSVPWDETVIYETHVKGITIAHPDVPEEERGTFLGLASPVVIDHLRRLGVTTVQLLPVQSIVDDERLAEQGLVNYWGYNTLNYFAPEPRYSSNGPTSAVVDFKTMVRELHRAGLEVIIDVVYNHTGEADGRGPTLSFRGIDNRSYYKLMPDDGRNYRDYTGTGNTLDPGNPYVLQLITDSLRYWVTEMHVDGFRFDLAAALARELFDVDMLSAFFKVIQQDPVLSRVKLIAEPWDVGPGGYQVGNFPWYWTEWNGRYRDAVRSYWRGDPGRLGEFATRISGSSDLYASSGRRPWASINFVSAHDGFTLEDTVSYERKHNLANLEGNRDGHEPNLSSNAGVEGASTDPEIRRARSVRKRSLMATLLLSQGIPMLLGGDELGRTQRGNNNAYCQDNEISWYDWTQDAEQASFHDFVAALVSFRRAHPVFRRRTFLEGSVVAEGWRDVSWWQCEGRLMEVDDWERDGAIGKLLHGGGLKEPTATGEQRVDDSFLVVCQNRRSGPFVLPPVPSAAGWRLCVETGAGIVRDGGVGDAIAPGTGVLLAAGVMHVYVAASATATGPV